MNMIKRMLIMAIMAQLSFGTHVVMAESVSTQTKSEVRAIKAALKRLRRLANRSDGRVALSGISGRGLDDSDSDGLPDLYENALGSDSCDSDSDHDGISDDDEGKSGSDPDDSTSGEIELKGLITAITETTVTVEGQTFTVTLTTEFGRGATSLASFVVGNRVEVKGKLQGGVLTLKKIKTDN